MLRPLDSQQEEGDDTRFDLKVSQHSVLRSLLRLEDDADAELSQWKVLVYDARGADVLTPTLHVGELRAAGVTLWLRLEADRQAVGRRPAKRVLLISCSQVPDAPVVYLMAATPANVRRVARDLQQGLYSSAHINFLDSCPPALLEDLALQAVEAGRAISVESVWERHVDFVALESDLFSLNVAQSYALCNDETIGDTEALGLVNRMVGGLVSCCCTLGRVPVIRCNPASLVARKVCEMLCDALHQLVADGTLSDGGGRVCSYATCHLMLTL
jgi:hypothetical protein